MNRVFAKSIAALFAGAMLVATSASHAAAVGTDTGPGWYCLKMPTHGETRWTGRDNRINLRVKVAIWANGAKRVGHHKRFDKETGYFDVDGNVVDRNSWGKQQFRHAGRNVCVPMYKVHRKVRQFHPGAHIQEFSMEVRHGWNFGKCPIVKGGATEKNHLFKLWQRKHDLVHPFSCGKMRSHIDSPWPGVKNIHEQVKKPPIPKQVWFVDHKSLPWERMLFEWKKHPSAYGTGVKERARWDHERFKNIWGVAWKTWTGRNPSLQ
ncbi:MAG: hypothetical protein ACR2P7_02305 [bacterium]